MCIVYNNYYTSTCPDVGLGWSEVETSLATGKYIIAR